MTATDSGHKVPVAAGSGSVAPVVTAPPGSAEDGVGWRRLHPRPPPPLRPSEALSAPCANGGTAVGHDCVCPPGHSGHRCETPDPAGACRNGGTRRGDRLLLPPRVLGDPGASATTPPVPAKTGPPPLGQGACARRASAGTSARSWRSPDRASTVALWRRGRAGVPPRLGDLGASAAGRAPPRPWGKVLYVNDTAGTNDTVTATTVGGGTTGGGTTDTPSVRRARNVTARPVEGNATTMGSGTVATTNGGIMGRNVTVTALVSATMVSHGVASTDHGMVTVTERDTEVSAGTDHDVVTTTEKATRVRGSVPMATTTPMLPARWVRNVTASPMRRNHSRATTMEGETTAVEGDTTVTRSDLMEGDTTAMEGDTTAMDGETTVMEGDTEATPMEGDTEATPMEGGTEATPVATTVNNTRATTVESGTVTVPPGHPGSHSRATTRARNTTAMGNNTRLTTLKGDTSVTTMEGNTRAMENKTWATITESDTTATTLEGDTTAMPMIIMGGHTRAVENNTRVTTLKSDTRATTLETHTLSTLPITPADVTSTPAPPNATSTILDATESPPNATEATGALAHVSAGTTGDVFTSSTVPTMATICLYLPHGASPPAIVCHNGGVANRTHCLCPPGYSGPTCETPDPTDRCAGGSTAVGDRCICPPGRTGPRCATPDPATACRHGGTAVGTECYCLPGFSGPRCEDPSPTTAPTARPPRRTRATPRSTRRTTTTTTVPTTRDPCLNGGLWMGTACLCPPNMDGPRCEFGATTINLTAELGPFVTMMARVTNRDFSEDMRDTSSPGHRRFAEEFSRTMDGIYRNVSGYRGINVLSLSRGSVVVNYRVQLRPLPSNASLEHRALELLAVANAASQPHNCSTSADGLCFTATSARATRAA
ncbi:mucin-3A-like, partial [Anomalospiza imberbis]|uniref:mucin-3A-like n=1 Tax=Anomalospiza imberbis TaxID=187417 RepID=UPI00358E0715